MRKFINEYKFYILSFLAVFLLILAVYGQCISFDIVFLDDSGLLLDSLRQSQQLSNIKSVFTNSAFDTITDRFYRPILNLSFFADSFIGGGALWFYHYTNILLHIFAVCLLLALFNLTGYSKKVSLIVSMVFAVHPALVPAAAWIPGRNDSLLAVFIFLSFIFFIKSVQTDKKIYTVLSALSFFIALLTKETALVLPVMFAIYEYAENKKLKAALKTELSERRLWIASSETTPPRNDKAGVPCHSGLDPGSESILSDDNKKNGFRVKPGITQNSIKRLIIFLFPIIIYFLLRCFIFKDSVKNVSASVFFDSFSSSFLITVWYFAVAFISQKAPLYPQFDITLLTLINGFITIISVSLLLFIFREKINFKRIAFALLWFMIFLIPSYIMPANNYYTHRLYIPIAGILIITADIFMAAYAKFPKLKKVFYILPALIILLFAAMSYNQSAYYKNREAFWFKAYEENPNSYRTNSGLSSYYESIGDLDKAEKYVLAALELAKDKRKILFQAGTLYHKKQDFVKASQYYIKAIAANQYLEGAYYALSALHLEIGNKEAAVEILEKAVEIVPQSKRLKNALRVLREKQNE